MKTTTKKTAKVCKKCKSPMDLAHVEYPYWHDNELVALVNDVPCWVCQLCGERYFESAVETTLHYIVEDYIKLGSTFPIPTTPYRLVSHRN